MEHSVHPLPFLLWGGGVEPPTNFQKGEAWQDLSFTGEKGDAGEKGMTFSGEVTVEKGLTFSGGGGVAIFT